MSCFLFNTLVKEIAHFSHVIQCKNELYVKNIKFVIFYIFIVYFKKYQINSEKCKYGVVENACIMYNTDSTYVKSD